MNSKFCYCSSWDELTWTVDVSQRRVYRLDISWDHRTEIQNWIQECCSGRVYCWNGTSTPAPGSQNWGYITPKQSITWLTFDLESDETQFLLAHSSLLLETYANGHQAWQASRTLNNHY
jgi:hypothetical protein